MRKLVLAALAAAALTVPAGAQAVTYSFTAETGFGYGAAFTGDFTYERPDPVTALTFVDPTVLDSCHVSYAGAGVCRFAQFQPNDAGLDVIGFAVSPTLTDPVQTFFYYFEAGAFGRNGTYATRGGPDNMGHLTVAKIGAPVPEPGTWELMIVGFGLTGALLRRERAVDCRTGRGRRPGAWTLSSANATARWR